MERNINFTANEINNLLGVIRDKFAKPGEITLGKYIIKYNAVTDALDFLYTGVSTIDMQYENGTFNQNGEKVADNTNTLLRSADKIPCYDCFDYYLYCADACSGFVYYLYDENGSLIDMSDPKIVQATQNAKIETTEDTAYIAYRFTSITPDINDALDLTGRIVLYSIGKGEEPVIPDLPVYDFIDPIETVDPEVGVLTFERGSIYSETGLNEDDESSSSVRTVETIMVVAGKPYNLIAPTLPNGAKMEALRLYYYDANGVWLGTTSKGELSSGEKYEFEIPAGVSGLRFKYRLSTRNVNDALDIGAYIIIERSDSYMVDLSSASFEGGTLDIDTGEEVNDSFAIRLAGKLQVKSNQEYNIFMPGGSVSALRFFYFDINGNYTGCSQNVAIEKGGGASFTTLSSTGYIVFKFNSAESDTSQAKALEIASTIQLVEQLPE